MDDNIVSRRQIGVEPIQYVRYFRLRIWYLTIGDRQRAEFYPFCFRLWGLSPEIEILLLFRSQQGKHGVNSSPPPACHFISQPIAATGTRSQGQLSGPKAVDPIELGPHPCNNPPSLAKGRQLRLLCCEEQIP